MNHLVKVFCRALLILVIGSWPAISGAGEMPASFTIACKKLTEVNLKAMRSPGISKRRRQDVRRDSGLQQPGPYRFAIDRDVKLNTRNAGTWETLPGGSRLWRLRIRSRGAISLNLGINRFHLPEGAKLWLYQPSGNYIKGPYLNRHGTAGELWTPIIPGDRMVVELYVPAESNREPVVHIGKVNHGYRGFYEQFDGSGEVSRGPCNIDVLCPQVRPWEKQVRAVAFYTVNGKFKCSGVLLNNTRVDFKPYFLTACHCRVNSNNARTMVVYWNYESPDCGECLDGDRPGRMVDHQTGAYYRAGWDRNDFVLVELKERPDPRYNVYYSGWDASGTPPKSVFGIHHPRGHEKSYACSDYPVISTDKDCKEEDPEGKFWCLERWRLGTTENYSSGSGLWDAESGLCLGQLWGGYADCAYKRDPCQPNDKSNWYGKFSSGWQGGKTPSTRLKDWLDPENRGTLKLNGADPRDIEKK